MSNSICNAHGKLFCSDCAKAALHKFNNYSSYASHLTDGEVNHVHTALNQQEYEQRYGSPAVRKLFFAELACAIVDEMERRERSDDK